MEIVICPDEPQVGVVAASRVAAVVDRVGPGVTLGVATGSSPLSLYTELARMVRSGQLDLTSANAFALDEYVGLPEGHPESYAEVVRRTVTEPLGMTPSRVHVPDGRAADLAAAAAAYDRSIRDAGGVDVQVLGIGSNGHIAFNEPTSSFGSRTRVIALQPRTRQDNARFFPSLDAVPRHALTQGLGTVMEARSIVLIALGEGKADAVAAMVEGPVTAMVPASILQLHPAVTVVVDEAAASKLTTADYHRFLQANPLPTSGR